MLVNDPEIAYAAQLGETLKAMRHDLSEEAIKRIVTFIFERWGLTFGVLYVKTITLPAERPATNGTKPKPEAMPEPESAPVASFPCPICEWSFTSARQLRGHMLGGHKVSLSAWQAQQEQSAA